jgi:hypothetical protein
MDNDMSNRCDAPLMLLLPPLPLNSNISPFQPLVPLWYFLLVPNNISRPQIISHKILWVRPPVEAFIAARLMLICQQMQTRLMAAANDASMNFLIECTSCEPHVTCQRKTHENPNWLPLFNKVCVSSILGMCLKICSLKSTFCGKIFCWCFRCCREWQPIVLWVLDHGRPHVTVGNAR